jgi:hypothetical protein
MPETEGLEEFSITQCKLFPCILRHPHCHSQTGRPPRACFVPTFPSLAMKDPHSGNSLSLRKTMAIGHSAPGLYRQSKDLE